jgi:hypothetical protein
MNNHAVKIKLIKSGEKQLRCESCGLVEWLEKPIPIELHHIDGNGCNYELKNLQFLCPNCHAFTPNYRGRGAKKGKNHVSDTDLLKIISSSYTKREALLKAGLAGSGGSYERINRLVKEQAIQFLPHPKTEAQLKRIKTIRDRYGSLPKSMMSKIVWPNKEELESLIKQEPTVKVAKKLGVSDSAVRKTAKRYKLDLSLISPWSKKHNPK